MQRAIAAFERRLERVTSVASVELRGLPSYAKGAESAFGQAAVHAIGAALESGVRRARPREVLARLYAVDAVAKNVPAYRDWAMGRFHALVNHARPRVDPAHAAKVERLERLWSAVVAQAGEYDPARPESPATGGLGVSWDVAASSIRGDHVRAAPAAALTKEALDGLLRALTHTAAVLKPVGSVEQPSLFFCRERQKEGVAL